MRIPKIAGQHKENTDSKTYTYPDEQVSENDTDNGSNKRDKLAPSFMVHLLKQFHSGQAVACNQQDSGQ